MTEDLAHAARRRMLAKLVGGLTCVMVAPPVIAGALGSLGLAIVVGILSIFAGLIGMSVVVSKWEFFQRRAEAAALPPARVIGRRQ